jgi:hypothetical protein
MSWALRAIHEVVLEGESPFPYIFLCGDSPGPLIVEMREAYTFLSSFHGQVWTVVHHFVAIKDWTWP